MNMTREEASVQIEGLKKYCEDMADSDESGAYVFDLDVQALDLAISALRPVSREQVEEACKSKWIQMNNTQEHYCESCGVAFNLYACCKNDYRFCPFCGAPMTDEAVDILLNRLEESKDGKTD